MRLIDADALIEKIHIHMKITEQQAAGEIRDDEVQYMLALHLAEEFIKTIPSAEQMPNWIPITEAKPGADHVLATLCWDKDDYEVTEIDYWAIVAAQNDEDYLISDRAKGIIKHVVAWMPMPEPWRGGDDE